MSDVYYAEAEIDLNKAVRVCQGVSEKINHQLKLLSYQPANCSQCRLQEECCGHMRLERLEGGTCAYREI